MVFHKGLLLTLLPPVHRKDTGPFGLSCRSMTPLTVAHESVVSYTRRIPSVTGLQTSLTKSNLYNELLFVANKFSTKFIRKMQR